MSGPWSKKLNEDEGFFSDSVKVTWGDINHVGGILGDGEGDESEGGQGAKERGELHEGRRESEWVNPVMFADHL